MELTVHIPANCEAEVHLPTASREKIKQGGQPLDRAKHVRFLRVERGRCVVSIQSGEYVFAVE